MTEADVPPLRKADKIKFLSVYIPFVGCVYKMGEIIETCSEEGSSVVILIGDNLSFCPFPAHSPIFDF